MSRSLFYPISSYFSYLSKSKTKHGVHSPFVYDLVTKVLENKQKNLACEQIHSRYKELLYSKRVVETTDFDDSASKKKYVTKFLTVSEIARNSSVSQRYGELLYRMVDWFKPDTILEVGTCLGISTLYLAKAAPGARIITMEGCAVKSELARTNFEKLEVIQVELTTGRFINTLPLVLNKMPRIDFVFIDGHHQYRPTIEYFEEILKHSHEETVLVIDDIHWSKGMEKAWEYIGQKPEVIVTIDLFRMGLVFLRKSLSKQNFVIRF